MTLKVRRTRSDKKVTIKPTIPVYLKGNIYKIAYITNKPIKNVAEELVEHSLNNNEFLSQLSYYFKIDVRINDVLYEGNYNNPKIIKRTPPGTSDRFTFRVKQSTYRIIETLAYTLDCSIARVCSLIIERILKDFDYINNYINNYLENNLDKGRMRKLKSLILFVNENSDVENSLAALLAHIFDEVKEPNMTIKESIDQFLVTHWG